MSTTGLRHKTVLHGHRGHSDKDSSSITTLMTCLPCCTVNCMRRSAVKNALWGFPGGAVVESLPANAGDAGSSPGLGRSHMPRSN